MKHMWQKREKLPIWWRGCCVCRLSVPPVHWLCSGCWQTLTHCYLCPIDMIREQGGLTHVRLFDWGEENDDFARLFLKSLKKGGPDFIFEKLAKVFLHRFLQVRTLPTQSVLIPAPASYQQSFKDHAFAFCQALSHVTGIPVQNPLLSKICKKSSLKQMTQKQKNRQERREIHFKVQQSCSLANKTVIFVDDILTTGATARSAWKALGKPAQFMIFTLSWRRFLFESRAEI